MPTPLHLERASPDPPPGLSDLLTRLGHGESGFGGTPFGRGECSLADFLRACVDGEDPAKAPPNLVPQTIYWIVTGADPDRQAIGMVRLRHHLNDRLLQAGGHVGYYVHPAHRGRGHATRALHLALARLHHDHAVRRALITCDPDNAASIRVIRANGGAPDGQGTSPDTGRLVNRYWIDLSLLT